MDSQSPLEAISSKEAELRRRLEAAKMRADAQIEAARDAAKRLIEQADLEGRAEAETRYRLGLTEVEQEAEAIVNTAQNAAQTLRQTAEASANDAIRKLVNLVISTGSTS